MSLGFPTTGLEANVTTYVKGGRTWLWNGNAWQLQTTLNGYVGSIGYTGSASNVIGYTGSEGIQGIQGVRGLQGNSIRGDVGFSGSQGIAGVFAGKGYDGSQGGLGYSGSIGYAGSEGYVGSKGELGYSGSLGIGYAGSQGVPGYATSIGYTGSIGPAGNPGGYTGSAAYMGSSGYAGSSGIGYTGSGGAFQLSNNPDQVLVNDGEKANSYAGFTFNKTTNTLFIANTLTFGANVYLSKNTINFSNSQILYLPIANTTSPLPYGISTGAIRYNSDLENLETYNTSTGRWKAVGSSDTITSSYIIVYDDYNQLQITPLTLFAGNSTVNTTISSTGVSTDDPTNNTTITSQLLFVGNTSSNAAINLYGGEQTFDVSYYSVSSAGIATIQIKNNHGFQGIKGIVGKLNNTGFYYIDNLSSFVVSDFGTPNTFNFSLTSAKTASNLKITALERLNGYTKYYTTGEHYYNINDTISITGIPSNIEKGPYNYAGIQISSIPNSNSFITYDPARENYTANIISISNEAYESAYKGPVYLKFTLDEPHDFAVGDSIFLDIPYAYADYIMYSGGDSIKGIVLRDPDDPEDLGAYTKNYRIETVPNSTSFEVIVFYKNRNTRSIDSGIVNVNAGDIGTVTFFTDRNLEKTDITTSAYASIPVVLNVPTNSSVLLTSPIYISVSNSTSITKITPASFFLGTPGGNNITIESTGTRFNTRGSYLQTFINGRGITIASLQEEDGQVLPEAAAFFANSSVISIGNTTFTTVLSSESITTKKIVAGTTDNFVSIENNQISISDTTNIQNTVITSFLADFGGDVSVVGDFYVGNRLYANGTIGTNDQALFANSSGGVYWSDGGVGYTGSSGYIGQDGYTGSTGAGYVGSSGSGYIGSKGYAGSRGTGFTGSRAYTGSTGYVGSVGYVGSQGIEGYVGSEGGLGYTGSQGEQGIAGEFAGMGYDGSQGELGYSGSIGYSGSQGIPGEYAALGFDGSQGEIGYVGSEGYAGSKGFLGARGWTGSVGAGYSGSDGYVGSTGYVGSQGIPGEAAAIGYTGSIGAGYSGSQGVPGEYAALGFDGSQGDLGYTGSFGYVGSIGYAGSQGIAGEFAGKGYDGSQGDKGYSGSQGIPGAFVARGYTGSFGYSGSEGYAGSQGGLGYSGSQGEQGIAGEYAGLGFDGSQGEIGYTGSQGIAGEYAALGYSGSEGYAGSQGELGYSGSQGVPGEYAALGYSGSEGYAGSQGGLGYSGSQGEQGIPGEYAALGFTGSNGDTGYVGSMGIPGYATSIGYTGSQGVDGYIGSQGELGYSGSNGGFINGESIEVHNIVITNALVANNSFGIADQVLTANGAGGVYWKVSGSSSLNIDGGGPTTNYGGIVPIDAGGVI